MGAGWDIDPLGVRAVVTRTKAAAGGFADAAGSYQTGCGQAAANCDSALVARALVGFATHHERTLPELVSSTYASLTATVRATNAYLVGDLEMAAHAQRAAHHAPERMRPR